MTANVIKKKIMTRTILNVFLFTSILFVAGCGERMAPASVTGYNHTKNRAIANFYVNGAMGSNLNPESGGGAQSCCVSIPEVWRPGLKAKIAWRYDKDQGDPTPPPPPQELEVEIPEYKQPGKFQVHFYDDHKIKVVISSCLIEHPFYPMNPQDKLPWEADGTKEEAIASHKRGGMDNDC
jgi:hypothetical protein